MSETAEEDFCKNANHTWLSKVCRSCGKPLPTVQQTLYWAASSLAGKGAKIARLEAELAVQKELVQRICREAGVVLFQDGEVRNHKAEKAERELAVQKDNNTNLKAMLGETRDKLDQAISWWKEWRHVVSEGHYSKCEEPAIQVYRCQENGRSCVDRMAEILTGDISG